MRKPYPTDLSDVEWQYLELYVPPPKRRRRLRVHSPREVLNAIFYVLKTGYQWHMLPREFPPYKTVFHYFRQWRLDGTWKGSIEPSASGYVRDWDVTLSPAPG